MGARLQGNYKPAGEVSSWSNKNSRNLVLREGKLEQIRTVLPKAGGENAGRKKEIIIVYQCKRDRKDLLFMFVVRTARNRLKGRMMSGLCRGTVVTTAKTSSARIKPLLCWVGNKESNQTAALDCNSISML